MIVPKTKPPTHNPMKMKTVTYYVDLWPGWQDQEYLPCPTPPPAPAGLTQGCRRFKITVELPCFGGSAEAEGILGTRSEEVQTGFQAKGGAA